MCVIHLSHVLHHISLGIKHANTLCSIVISSQLGLRCVLQGPTQFSVALMVLHLQCDQIGDNDGHSWNFWELASFEWFYFILVVFKGLIEAKASHLLSMCPLLVVPTMSRRDIFEDSPGSQADHSGRSPYHLHSLQWKPGENYNPHDAILQIFKLLK